MELFYNLAECLKIYNCMIIKYFTYRDSLFFDGIVSNLKEII